jgi:hypothetical protein
MRWAPRSVTILSTASAVASTGRRTASSGLLRGLVVAGDVIEEEFDGDGLV